ncbi:MAG: nickel/cobalt efflux transporter [Candidatus Omnitrophota bacterium]
MPSFNELITQGNAWLFFPFAMLLGAIHGLEPGHSKTMMTAFIISIQGTVWQAFLLGISATFSHTAVIWLLAFIGLRYSESLSIEELEPYFQLATGIIIVGLAGWMFYRTRQAQKEFRLHQDHHTHGHHDHDSHENHDHSHTESELEFGDAHERAHALELQKHLANRNITTGQIILFGLTGGLLPCPSAFAVLLVCLQLKEFTLGFALVLAFSLGLAVTLVVVGVVAAVSVKHATKRFKGFGEIARKLPYISSGIMALIGMLVAVQGLRHIFTH